MEKATLIQNVEYAYRVLFRIQEMEQQENSISMNIQCLAKRPSNGIVKRFFRFLGVYLVVLFIMACFCSLIQPIISLFGFSILDLFLGIIYSLTGIDMTLLLDAVVLFICAVIAVKYIRHKRKKKEEQFAAMDEEIVALKNEYSEVERGRQRFISENIQAINWIPQDYRRLDVLAFIKKMLVDGRADTWKEAVNLYHEKKNEENNRRQQMMMHIFSEINADLRNRSIVNSLDRQSDILDNINRKILL